MTHVTSTKGWNLTQSDPNWSIYLNQKSSSGHLRWCHWQECHVFDFFLFQVFLTTNRISLLGWMDPRSVLSKSSPQSAAADQPPPHSRAENAVYVTSFWMLLEFRSVGVIPFYVWLRSSGIRMIHLHPAHFTDRLRHEVTRRLNECSKCATRARWKVWKEERSSTCWESDVQNWPYQNL